MILFARRSNLSGSSGRQVLCNVLEKEKGRRLAKLLLPDFFIGAHAEAEGMSLVTRDPARIKSYFPAVDLITP